MTLNEKVIEVLNGIAMFRALEGETWRATAYSRAAETIGTLAVSLEQIYDEGELYDLNNVGKSVGEKIEEIIQTGTCKVFETYKVEYPGLIELTRVDGIGPKKAYKYWKEHGVRSLQDLKAKLDSGQITNASRIRESVEHLLNQTSPRLQRTEVLPFVEKILTEVQTWPGVLKAEFAGSMRRESTTVRDVDIIVAVENEKMVKVHARFVKLAEQNGHEVLAHGEGKSRIRLPITVKQKIQVDLLTILPVHYGAALNYFTGSREHNIKVRAWAKQHGWLVNEYGVWNDQGKRLDTPGLNERALFEKLRLVYIDPKDRDGSKLTPIPTQ